MGNSRDTKKVTAPSSKLPKDCTCSGFKYAVEKNGLEPLFTMSGDECHALRFHKPKRGDAKTFLLNFCPWCGKDLLA